MGFKVAILLVSLFVYLTAARFFSPFKARAVQNDGVCGADTTCLEIRDPFGGSAAGCCWDNCEGQRYYTDHLSNYDFKCSGGKICCGYKDYGPD